MDAIDPLAAVVKIGRASKLTRGGPLPPAIETWPLRVYVQFGEHPFRVSLAHRNSGATLTTAEDPGRAAARGGIVDYIRAGAAERLRRD